jgi:inner membrane protein
MKTVADDLSHMQSLLPSRSMGMKLILVAGLALFMTIPALFVRGLLQDRKSRAAEVTQQISSQVGGRQTFLGPTLMIPYSIPPKYTHDSSKQGTYIVFPARASAVFKTATQERQLSLFKVPVFQAAAQFHAAFDLTGVPSNAPEGAVLDWQHAEIVVGVSDARGALADATITSKGKTAILAPETNNQNIQLGSNGSPSLTLSLFGTNASSLAQPGAKFSVSSTLRFSGAQRVAILAYGKTTQVSVTGDWPSPGFDGGFSPVKRTVSPHGFSAEWSVPFIARGFGTEGPSAILNGLDATAMGVSFIEVADPYQSVDRSLKYVLLFLGLIFLSYFIFEGTTGRRVHPAQYLLVGVAQLIFYLLLLSLAERIGFDFGFLLAGAATVSLLSLNAKWVFVSRREGLRALTLFTSLYVFIYLLLRLQDNALLLGTIASFAIVAAAMYFTRNLDWYSPLSISATSVPLAKRASEAAPGTPGETR